MNSLNIHGARLLGQPDDSPRLAVLIERDQIAAIGPAHELACPPGAEQLEADADTCSMAAE
jgi:hypothetical protein